MYIVIFDNIFICKKIPSIIKYNPIIEKNILYALIKESLLITWIFLNLGLLDFKKFFSVLVNPNNIRKSPNKNPHIANIILIPPCKI